MLHAFLRAFRALAASLMVGALACASVSAAHSQTTSNQLPQPSAHGLRLVEWLPLRDTPRLWNAVVATDALSEPVHVAVYLPADYDSQPGKRYPVLYLLHGHGDELDHALPWVVAGNAPAIVDASPFKGIVVMPQCGRACWYTDWLKATPGGYKPQWETYYIQQLLPWIDANFRTQGAREGRAIAGLSMGGYGALAMSARFPYVFGHVGSFSSLTNIQDLIAQQMVIANTVTLVTGAAYVSSQKGAAWLARDVQDVFGSYWSDSWRRRNPFAMADVYGREKVKLALYAGGGAGAFDMIESGVGPSNDKFHAKLKASGSPHRYCRGDTGRHNYEYWQGDLADFLAVLAGQAPANCPHGWGLPRP